MNVITIDHKLINAASARLDYAKAMRAFGIIVTADGHHIPVAEYPSWDREQNNEPKSGPN